MVSSPSRASLADGDRPVQRADDAAGHGGLEAERRADRDDLLADVEVVGVADRRRGQAADVLGLDHGEVGHRVGADDGGLGGACRR